MTVPIYPPPPDPKNYRPGALIFHRCYPASGDPRPRCIRLRRGERRVLLETWELASARYVPAQGAVGLDAARALKIEAKTRPLLPDVADELHSPRQVSRQALVEGMGAVMAVYERTTAELVVPVWLDPEGRIR